MLWKQTSILVYNYACLCWPSCFSLGFSENHSLYIEVHFIYECLSVSDMYVYIAFHLLSSSFSTHQILPLSLNTLPPVLIYILYLVIKKEAFEREHYSFREAIYLVCPHKLLHPCTEGETGGINMKRRFTSEKYMRFYSVIQ